MVSASNCYFFSEFIPAYGRICICNALTVASHVIEPINLPNVSTTYSKFPLFGTGRSYTYFSRENHHYRLLQKSIDPLLHALVYGKSSQLVTLTVWHQQSANEIFHCAKRRHKLISLVLSLIPFA